MSEVFVVICVHLPALKVDSERVQKDVDLEGIINNYTQSFFNKEEASVLNYAPLSFGVSIRSMYDNTVVGRRLNDGFTYYRAMTEVSDFPHKGYDLLMYVSSLVVISMSLFSPVLRHIMTQHSQIQPIGLFNPDPKHYNPMVYSHIIMSDEGMNLLSEHLKPEYFVDRIADMKCSGNRKPILDTLIEIKEEDK